MSFRSAKIHTGSMVPPGPRGNNIETLNLEHLIGNFTACPTVKSILDSLGTFDEDASINHIHGMRYQAIQNASYVPFTLSEDGKLFFGKLLDIESISSRSCLLTFKCRLKNPEKYAKGVRSVPAGILIEGRSRSTGKKQTFSFDLSRFIVGNEDHLRIFSDIMPLLEKLGGTFFGGNQDVTMIYLDTGSVDCGPSEKIILPSINHRGIFSHKNKSSRDFQSVLIEYADLFNGKRVVESGAGSFINSILALKYGAVSLWANDISPVYVMLSRWNLQFAQDTGQIKGTDKRPVKIVHGKGLEQAPEADIYLFNAPSIRGPLEMKRQLAEHGKLGGNSLFMPEAAFLSLFQDLKRRLSRPGTLALWRILPMFHMNSRLRHFPNPSGTFYNRFSYDFDYVLGFLRAREFLKKHGLEYIPHNSRQDIFLLRKPDRRSRRK